MPSNAPIVIADGASTPVNHTFNPESVVGRLATFQEVTSGVPVGYPKLTFSTKAPSSSDGAWTVQLRLTQPKVITTTDTTGKTVTSVDYTNLADLTFKVSARSTLQERKDLRVLLDSALKNALLVQAADGLESFW
jgi:hypothetical protein